MKKALLLNLFIFFSFLHVFGQNPDVVENTRLDSLDFEISILGGFHVNNIPSYKNLSSKTGAVGFARIHYRFWGGLWLYGQFGISNQKIEQQYLPWNSYSMGFLIEITQTQFRPYLLAGWGQASFEGGQIFLENNPTRNFSIELPSWKSNFYQMGLGLNVYSQKGYGFKMELSVQGYRFLKFDSSQALNNSFYLVQGGIGLIKRI
jgi:hypothetical protein